jgi:pimeloyl-ACP methyl ester carboxylesterase
MLSPLGSAQAQDPAAATPAAAPATRHLAIDEGAYVDINGVDQWITIRGQDSSNPVLLFLHGGPGMGSAALAPVFAEWEKSFTLVQWDQPGGGFTLAKNPTAQGPMTIERFKKDGIAVAEHVRKRLGVRKLVLMGNSWGTLLGVEMVKARPELFSAYVGSSQAVGDAGNKLGYQLALKAARDRNDAVAVAALEKVGLPPYEKFEDLFVRQQYSNPPALPASAAEQAAQAEFYGALAAPAPADAHYLASRDPVSPEKFWNDFVAAQKATYRQTWSWEARALGLKFAMPVFVYQGAQDFNTPAQTAREWFDDIQAPKKGFELIADASHNTLMFQKELLRLINRDVRPLVTQDGKVAQR